MIFVTGGTGLVGSHLLLALVRRYGQVKALRRKTSDINLVRKVFSWYSPDSDELYKKIEWVEGDVLDIFSLGQVLNDVDMIYHCAAVVSFEPKRRKEMIHNNVEGTTNIVNAALDKGIKKICHVSSNSALGKSQPGEAVTEETNWMPSKRNSGYSESKFFSETEIWRGIEEGLDAVVVNPSIIIGPGNWNNGSTGFFPAIYKGLRFYTKGTTGFVDVRDVADAILLLTEKENFEKAKRQKFLISAENLSYHDLFSQIAKSMGKPRPSIYASGAVLEIAWRVASLWSTISGQPARITHETVAKSNLKQKFDGSKITRMFDFKYRPVQEAIIHTAICFLNDNPEKRVKN
jgi:dihydroflavonol-4-reductase